MSLNETNFGKIVVELNNFTSLINPEAISEFEGMTNDELTNLASSGSFKGEVAKWYQFLLKSMQIISATVDEE